MFTAMQCAKGTSYKPCASTCPLKTCDNMAMYKKITMECREEPCHEGCSPDPCPEGSVFESEESKICVRTIDCKVKCIKEDGVQYYEGDEMEGDDFQKW